MSKEGTIAERAFLNARDDLGRDPAWSAIDVSAYVEPAAGVATPNLADQPRRVGWKVRLLWSVGVLAAALGLVDPQKLAALDARFDASERRLFAKNVLDLTDSDPALQEAAKRVQALLLPDGLKQINYTYDQEVLFGRGQITLAVDHLSAEVALLGLQPFLDQVSAATEALAAALGIAPGKTRDIAKSHRIKEALRSTQRDFKAVLSDILWHAEHAPTAADREALLALTKPLQAALQPPE